MARKRAPAKPKAADKPVEKEVEQANPAAEHPLEPNVGTDNTHITVPHVSGPNPEDVEKPIAPSIVRPEVLKSVKKAAKKAADDQGSSM